jgi:hypothetical protein
MSINGRGSRPLPQPPQRLRQLGDPGLGRALPATTTVRPVAGNFAPTGLGFRMNTGEAHRAHHKGRRRIGLWTGLGY